MNHITIGLDYDGTVTSDPVTFAAVMKTLRQSGHKVIVITMRYQSECERDSAFMEFVSGADGYHATGRQAKKSFMEKLEIPVHVWVDDNPEAVYKSAAEIWGTASPEGVVVTEVHENGKPTVLDMTYDQEESQIRPYVFNIMRGKPSARPC